jgi:transposase-like protein
VSCPFCASGSVEQIGQWGGQLVTSQWRCTSCGSYFEALRADFEDAQAARTWPECSSERK